MPTDASVAPAASASGDRIQARRRRSAEGERTPSRSQGARPRREAARPFLKWAGGKSQLLAAFDRLFPDLAPAGAYHEPFVGSGAVFFHLAATGRVPRRAVLSDANEHLVTTWQVVRDSPRALAKRLAALEAEHSPEAYYRARDRFNEGRLGKVDRAAVLIYLNKTGFNGLYRVNGEGKFNVPCGRQDSGPCVPNEKHLAACAAALRGVELACESFAAVLERAQPGDFVYFDPPYVPLSTTAYFTDYAEGGFGPDEQEHLRDVFVKLDRRGCKVMLSNSDTPFVRRLYRSYDLVRVSARRAINSKASARGPVSEVVVRNYA